MNARNQTKQTKKVKQKNCKRKASTAGKKAKAFKCKAVQTNKKASQKRRKPQATNPQAEASAETISTAGPFMIAHWLRELNMWRRGLGKYEWNEDPMINEPCPLSPRAIGILLDRAAMLLECGGVYFTSGRRYV